MQELAPYTSITEENKDEISTIVYKFCTAEFIDGLYMDCLLYTSDAADD